MAVKEDLKAKKKSWYYVFEVRDNQGKRVTFKKRGFTTKGEATKAEIAAKNEVLKGSINKPTSMTFGDYLNDWLRNRRDLRDVTKKGYTTLIEKHIIPEVGRVKLVNINAMTIESLLSAIEEKGLSESFNKNVFKIIHKALSDAERKQMIPRNPAALISKPKVSKKEMAHWSPDEARDFLAVIADHRLAIVFVLALHCGMRQGEILGLRMSDIDLQKKMLYIRNILNFKRELQVGTKTAAGTRSISISAFVVEAIHNRLLIIESEKLNSVGKYNDEGFLICTKNGRPLPKHDCHKLWNRLLDKHGMRKIRFHDLRHTCASLLLSLGIHPKIVQERLGHTSYKITMDLYSHLMPNMQSDASDALENLLK